jgi:hypothetical protein
MGRFSGEGMCKPEPGDGVSLVTLETSTLLVVGFLLAWDRDRWRADDITYVPFFPTVAS